MNTHTGANTHTGEATIEEGWSELQQLGGGRHGAPGAARQTADLTISDCGLQTS